jgi:hypothetical protein
MSEWDATTYEAKDNLLRVVRHEADRFFALAQAPGAWERRPPARSGRYGTSSGISST